ncbi:MAG TPA: TonB C-terminal domain-containing protein [Polyangiaceae bacterium]|nr:TonB C-terminal domain-containing protein [Polyangiaceae bacterium]
MNDAQAPAFTTVELAAAVTAAAAIQVGFFSILIAAGSADAKLSQRLELPAKEIPIAVQPVLDDTPLLKLGGKKVKTKLPDMWKKQAPVQRFEEKSAPSEKAEKTPEAIPTSQVATQDAAAPPPDAELAKEVDEPLLDAAPEPTQVAEGEGAPDGVKEGTETDPLKARAVGGYRAKLIAWFSSRFHIPPGSIACAELKSLSSSVSTTISPDGTVSGFSVGRASGNGVFDGRVQATMQGVVGQQVPPPPPLYPDILPPALGLNFLGKTQRCE